MEIYAFMINGKCPKCGGELDTGFNCTKCEAKIYKVFFEKLDYKEVKQYYSF
jgi:tRNA(Ile2) C34 agmatinyltransferase TiaS